MAPIVLSTARIAATDAAKSLGDSMRSLTWKWLPVLGSALVAACGGELDDVADEQIDELSDTTYSMEMVRANPRLAPSVQIPESKRVNGRGRPDLDEGERAPAFGPWRVEENSFLYQAAQLDQFLKLADPKIHKDDVASATYSRQPGDLYAEDGKFTWLNVEQGSLGDCYFVAGLASVLQADPSLAAKIIEPRKKDGKVVSYYVNFYQASGRKVRVEVDPDLPHRNSSGSVLYMRSTDTKPGYEEWAGSLIEKGYAKWHGSYNSIGNGGYASDAIYALSGKKTRYYSGTSPSLPAAIERGATNKKPMAACTHGEKDGVNYSGTGVYADHCYTIRGVRKSGSQTLVQLRNPWGPGDGTEPTTDGVQDGLFELPLATFQKLFANADIAY